MSGDAHRVIDCGFRSVLMTERAFGFKIFDTTALGAAERRS